MGDPSGKSRLELIDQIRSHVEITARWSAAKPLDGTADEKVDVPFLYIDNRNTDRLIRIHHDKSADLMGTSYNRVNGDT